MQLKLAHSPDSDDAFMFYGLAAGKVPTGELEFVHVLEDIETLNRKAFEEVYDVSAISFHAYPYLREKYGLLTCGASFGDGYGPLLVARADMGVEALKGRRVAIPGTLTTAFLVLKLVLPDFEPVAVPFDRVLSEVAQGGVDAGLIIHEGQLTFEQEGLRKVLDLGEWWQQQTELPLPLGGNVVRRSLGEERIRAVARLLRASIQYALEHREAALAHALGYARGMDASLADRFVNMYVNHWTLDFGEKGRRSVQTLLDMGSAKGILPSRVRVDFFSDSEPYP
jgi:1,4-dihydroxy-6-naphthoate synthase